MQQKPNPKKRLPYNEYQFQQIARRLKRKKIKSFAAAAALAIAAVMSIVFKTQLRALFTLTSLESVYSRAEKYPLAIYFLDSGNAGCTLIHSDAGDILIDCGHEKAQTNAAYLLDYLSVNDIDLAFLTHPERDHIGNFAEICQKYCPKRFVTCEYSANCESELYINLTDKLTQLYIPIEYAHKGEKYDLGSIQIEVISPSKVYKSVNDNSLVLRLTYGDFSALFTGDITKRAERDILSNGAAINADLLCAAHHGSAGSSSEEFLAAVAPRYAVIPTQESKYLPTGETIDRLSRQGCKIFRTDISGTVAFFVDEQGEVTVSCEHDR